MTLYTTVEKVALTVPSISSLSNVTSAVVAHYISRVSAVMDSKLASAFTVPLSGSYPILEYIATDLTVYEIVGKRQITGTKNTENDWPSRFKDANDLLDGIVAGRISIQTSSGDAVNRASTSVPWSNTMDYTPTFNVDDMTKSNVDSDLLDDIEDDRD